MKQPIAMRCTKTQFEKIKDKLNVSVITDFDRCNFLTNNWCDSGKVSNIGEEYVKDECDKYEIYEEWNEKIFLEACGIEVENSKHPSLEEVKEYFKNAKTVQCICMCDGGSVDITENIETDIHEFNGGYWIDLESEHYIPKGVKLWGNGHWAKILTYKEKTFSITESQIKGLVEEIATSPESAILYLKEKLFTEAFESEAKLKVGKYYKHPNYPKFLTCLREDKTRFGIDVYGNWFDDGGIIKDEHQKDYQEATEQEVFEALKNEAVKRGLVKGEFIFPIDDEFNEDSSFKENINRIGSISEIKNGKLYVLGYGKYCVFKDGQWAGIQQSITLSEAEQQLKKKIIV